MNDTELNELANMGFPNSEDKCFMTRGFAHNVLSYIRDLEKDCESMRTYLEKMTVGGNAEGKAAYQTLSKLKRFPLTGILDTRKS